MDDKVLSHEDSLKLINQMIGRAKNNLHDTGLSAILWGTIIPICALFTYLGMVDVYRLPFNIWMLTLLGVVLQVFLIFKESRQPVKTYDDVAMDIIWMVFGFGMGIVVMIVYKLFSNLDPLALDSDPATHIGTYISSIYLFWYGVPGILCGGIKKFMPILFGGLLCWAFAIISLYTPYTTDMILIGVGAIFAWFIPGIILRKQYNRQKNV